MTRKLKLLSGSVLLAILAVLSLSACTAKAYPDQIALVVGNGVGDAHKVKQIVYPGEKVSTSGDEETWYLPAGARNYRLGQGADRDQPAQGYTAASTDGKQPRQQDNVYLTLNWSLNQKEDVLKRFAVFCGKYHCYDSEGNQDHSKDPHGAAAGWVNMLNENMSPAINRAVQAVLSQYQPTLWSDQTKWSEFGDKVSVEFMKQVKTGWATIGSDDFFCSNGETTRDDACKPVQVIIDKIQPSDGRVEQTSKDQAVAESKQSLNDAQIAQAKAKYGQYWEYFLGIQDSINACGDKEGCTIVIGQPGGIPTSP